MRRAHRTAHVRIWLLLAALLPLIFIAGLILRQDGPHERPPVRLDVPQEALAK